MGKTIKVTFDCGDAGKVTWEMPRDMIKPGLSDREAARLTPIVWEDSVRALFC